MSVLRTNNLLSRPALVVLIVLTGIGLFTSTGQSRDYKTRMLAAENALVETERQEGFACGLLTKKQAAAYLNRTDLEVAGTVIAKNSPVTNVVGKPRVDSCSYTSAGSNLNYIDIVTKRYESQSSAMAYFDEGLQKVLYLEARSSDSADKLFYSSGVFYALKGDMVIEVSAARAKTDTEMNSEAFTQKILQYVVTKL